MVEWWEEGRIKLKGGNSGNHFMQLLVQYSLMSSCLLYIFEFKSDSVLICLLLFLLFCVVYKVALHRS